MADGSHLPWLTGIILYYHNFLCRKRWTNAKGDSVVDPFQTASERPFRNGAPKKTGLSMRLVAITVIMGFVAACTPETPAGSEPPAP
ncbi:MAG: hypothetical protein P8X98_17285, partial [Woeseiaceae bacterium]